MKLLCLYYIDFLYSTISIIAFKYDLIVITNLILIYDENTELWNLELKNPLKAKSDSIDL